MKILLKVLLILSVGGFLLIGTIGCKKKKDTVAKVLVLNEEGEAVSDANVTLFVTPTVSPHPGVISPEEKKSDNAGYAIFDYTDDFNLGQAGFRVLNIEVNAGDSLFGEGIIKIEAEQTTLEKVIVAAP